jgi:hypothetical protein
MGRRLARPLLEERSMKRRIALLLVVAVVAAMLPSGWAMAQPPTQRSEWSALWTSWWSQVVTWVDLSVSSPADATNHQAVSASSQPADPVLPVALPLDPVQAITGTNDGEAYPEADPNG